MRSAHKERKANIEFLRLLAMFMVVSLHYLDKGEFLPELPGTWEAGSYMPWILESFSIAAVNIYVLIAGYFMVDSEFRITKALKLWLQILFYSLLIPVLFIATGVLTVKDLTVYDILQYIFPVSMNQYWFGTEYLLLLLLSPVLNAGVKALTRRALKNVLLVLLFVTSVIPSCLPVILSYDQKGYDLLWFLTLYVTAAYIRLYGFPFLDGKGKGRAAAGFLLSTVLIFGWMYGMNFIAVKTGHFTEKVTMSFHYNHILVWFAAVFAFYFFLQLGITGKKTGTVINWLARGTFGIYLLHEHLLMRYRWMTWMPWETGLKEAGAKTDGAAFGFGRYLASVLTVMLAGILIDFVRRVLFDLIGKLFAKCGRRKKKDADE